MRLATRSNPRAALALALAIRGEADASEEVLRSLPQDDLCVRFNLGWHALRRGDLQAGFEGLNAGRWVGVFGSPQLQTFSGAPIWNPAEMDPAGKTILLRSEGGLGDQVCNARFARDLAARGARVVLSCDPSLATLLSRVPGVSSVVVSQAAPGVLCDAWVPAMSAAYVLGHTFQTLLGRPFLRADPCYVEKWRAVIRDDGTFRVGIRWKGNPQFEHEQHREFDPAPLFALAELPGVTVYSLQRDEGREALPRDSKVIDLADHLATWEDTAAACASLDLVISSCTSVAHVAAGLGRPTWIIIPVMPYYLWAPLGETSPWYSSVRLFRQEKYGEWPLSRVRSELEALRAEVMA